LEVAYLLLYGELPNERELGLRAGHHVPHHAQREPEGLSEGFHYDAHPMAILCGVVGSLSAFYHDSIDVNDPD
jgi:citrate synthase